MGCSNELRRLGVVLSGAVVDLAGALCAASRLWRSRDFMPADLFTLGGSCEAKSQVAEAPLASEHFDYPIWLQYTVIVAHIYRDPECCAAGKVISTLTLRGRQVAKALALSSEPRFRPSLVPAQKGSRQVPLTMEPPRTRV